MSIRIIQGDCNDVLRTLPDLSVQCCVTSPPYFGLRDYGNDAQIGLEASPGEYVEKLVDVFREVRRVLRDDGTLWLNLGDSYNNFRSEMGPGQAVHGRDKLNGKPDVKAKRRGVNGLKEKDLIGIPWRVAFALQADGWYLRQDIIWHKPNPMPESVRDRCTKAHEYLFLMSKSEQYYFDHEAMREEAVGKTLHDLTGPGYKAPGQAPNTGNRKALRTDIESRHSSQIKGGQSLMAEPDGKRNRRSVWTIATQPFSEAHFATMAPGLAATCIQAGCPTGGTVLDPFGGAGTTGVVADGLQRQAVLIELNAEYIEIARRRIAADAPLFSDVSCE